MAFNDSSIMRVLEKEISKEHIYLLSQKDVEKFNNQYM